MEEKLASTQVENHLSDPVLADIRTEWDWVGPALHELKEQIPSLTWRPEDVYAECLYGDALLHVALEGFVITNVITDQYTKDRTLHFWICWARELGGNCVIKYLPFFRNVAQQLECKFFEVWTPVEELEPYLKEEGWSLDTRIFTRRVDE
ncbi:hypothetical protein [Limnobacter sp.]|uniref:hypothetical protein n=1 Tax=Limnobacter sp. TaxID=2003368 RepID=UPI0025BEB422|nr:hypothetical protein [Limnobacter sp.]